MATERSNKKVTDEEDTPNKQRKWSVENLKNMTKKRSKTAKKKAIEMMGIQEN